MMEDIKFGILILLLFLVIAFGIKFAMNKTKEVTI